MTPPGPFAVLQIQFSGDRMTEHSLWRFSRALHRAINERRPQDLEPLIDEDVEWAIYGPIDMFPFLGSRRGKAAVLEVCRQILIDTFDLVEQALGHPINLPKIAS
jgi:hypothetical protein